MTPLFGRVARGLATAALAAGGLLAFAGHAAASTPGFEPDANSYGTVTLYNATGAVITSGSTTSDPVAAYAVGSVATPPGANPASAYDLAFLTLAAPQPGENSQLWPTDQLTGATSYPATGAPAALTGLKDSSGNALPVVTGAADITTLATAISTFAALPSGSADANIYQLRLGVSGPGIAPPSDFQSLDISVDTATSTWTEIYPTGGTAPATTAPTFTKKPVLSGDYRVGKLETCVFTASSGSTAKAVWQANGVTIAGAVTRTFTPGAGQLGKQLRCVVTLSNSIGSISTASNSLKVGVGVALVSTRHPALSGTHKVGSRLSVSSGTWSPAASSYSYQWYLGSGKIAKATTSRYTLIKADKGHSVHCVITAHRAGYTNGVFKTNSVAISG